jgi:5-methyltetrahydropteroyltriglutamate--homocysteine methyltransferase
MAIACNLGFPRIGVHRELKRAIEGYWQGNVYLEELKAVCATLKRTHWRLQDNAGIEHVPSNDFSLYDHVLDAAAMLGAVPKRFGWRDSTVDLAVYFALARGTDDVAPLDMTKWFNTNYHYLVPEFEPGMTFRLASTKPVDDFNEALSQGIRTRPVLLGPVSFLRLGKSRSARLKPMTLLGQAVAVYEQVLRKLADAGAQWVQIDEPVLALDLAADEISAMREAYGRLSAASGKIKICLATYFGHLRDNLETACALPVAALHLDLVRAPEQLPRALELVGDGKILSLGLVNGRNVWRTDLDQALGLLETAADKLGKDNLMVAPSCSLLHCPIDLEQEQSIDDELKSWMAFATRKLDEVAILTRAINQGRGAVADALAENRTVLETRKNSSRIHNAQVRSRMAGIEENMLRRARPFAQRHQAQRDKLPLPPLPTTTIGSFPQTAAVRKARAALKSGQWSAERYEQFCRGEITRAVRFQEEIDLDVLVHGEFERTDMVEYFAGKLDGFAFTDNGWVQSVGPLCVRPPVIFGDVSRPIPMTVPWIQYAQSLTARPMKGMLTGPNTILQWSFARDDQPRRDTAMQIALAIRDEVRDLEEAGIRVIQIDEPALREGLPLRRDQWADYLQWSVDAFRLASCVARSETQIHTHMCYAQFGDIMEAIAALDADVISIEAARSEMELLETFSHFKYGNDIGPGVYDIHSPRVPETDEIIGRLLKALRSLRPDQLWVNPDCGLKTRDWPESAASLKNMVEAAKRVRAEIRSI